MTDILVNRERVELLCAALESGEYLQGQMCLHVKNQRHDVWCCLGVAGDVAARNGADISRRWDGVMEYIDSSGSVLGPSVRRWYGFADANPSLLGPDGEWRTAIRLNDGGEMNAPVGFTEIAAAFRRTFLEQSRE